MNRRKHNAPVTVLGFAAVMACVNAACLSQDKPAAPKVPPLDAKTATPAPAKSADKITLVYKAKKDLIARYKNTSELNIEVSGMKIKAESTSSERVTVTDVATGGNITFEQQTESQERMANGQKQPAEDLSKSKSTFVVTPDGTLVSLKEADSDDTKEAVREYVANSVIFPKTAVGVGDKWSHDYKASDIGQRDAHADFEVVASETKAGVDTFKIKMEFKETSGTKPLHVTGTYSVEKSSGDTVESDAVVENMAFSGADSITANGKMHSERTSGSPFDLEKSNASKPETKTIDDTVKGFEKFPGLFTLYRKKEAGRDTIYAEIKQDQLEKLMLLEVTASTGTSSAIVAGDPINDLLFKWVQNDDKILLVTPNINFRADEKSPINRALKRSFADGILESFKIEAKQIERKSVLINLSEFFRGDIAQISQHLSGGGGLAAIFGGGGGGYAMDREKTYVAALKNFPENMVVETQYHFMGRGGGDAGQADGRSLPLKVNYTLFPLADKTYRPRLADGRVGYFQTEYQSFDDDSKDDPTVRYIYRWNLEKADPKAALSKPKKPIVFWLDNAIPVEYRDAVKEGLLCWNSAFEKVGIKDAIVVNQMPDNADWDHADMRYNTIRWVASPDAGYAVAQFRVNPLTGEILNANITVDANFTRYIKLERKHQVNPASFFDNLNSPPSPVAIDPRKCEMAQGMMEQGWFGSTALRLMDPENRVDDKEYLHQYLRHVVTHEMGHIMGLRHNFIASTTLDMKELQDEKTIEKMGISASVMDYTPFNVFALKHKGVAFYQPTIGPYDFWAIQYGYTAIDATTPQGEVARLRNIASRCNEPGLAYQSDESADSFDPAVVRFDLGKDPLDYYQKTLEVSRHLLLHLGERVPKNGESYHEFTRDFQGLLGQYTRAASLAARYVGGLHMNRNYKGDPNEKAPLAPIAAGEQKRALQMVNTYILADDAFTFPRSYYTKLTTDPNAGLDFAAYLSGNMGDYPIRDQFSQIQASALRQMFNASVLRRVVNNEFKVGDASQALTLPYLFHTVGGTVWSELDAHKNIGTLHRQLQRAHLDTLIGMVTVTNNAAPDDAKLLAWDQLRQIKSKIGVAASGPGAASMDEYTRVHLAESLMRISRALDAKMTIGAASSSRSSSPFAALFGTEEGAKKSE